MRITWINSRRYSEADDGAGSGESTGGGAVGTGNDARVALLNQIGDSVDETRGEELANVNDDDTTTPFRVEGDKTPPENAGDEPPQPPEDAAPATAPAPEPEKPQLVKLKVNGQELELPLEEVIARAQKVESADRYLAEAKKAAQPPAPPAPAPQPEEELDFKALVRAVQVGTEEEAEAALRTFASKTQRPSKPDDVFRVVDERLQFRDAIRAFNTEFNDIVSDPILKSMAEKMDQDMIAQGDSRPYSERYSEIGNHLRGWVSKLSGGAAAPAAQAPAPAPAASAVDRAARKAEAPQVPQAAAKKDAPPAPEAEEDDSASSVIAKMANARGGPQWMRA